MITKVDKHWWNMFLSTGCHYRSHLNTFADKSHMRSFVQYCLSKPVVYIFQYIHLPCTFTCNLFVIIWISILLNRNTKMPSNIKYSVILKYIQLLNEWVHQALVCSLSREVLDSSAIDNDLVLFTISKMDNV